MDDKLINQLVRQEQAAYMRQWRQRNRDRCREINKRYWLRRAMRNAEEIQSMTPAELKKHIKKYFYNETEFENYVKAGWE